AQKLTRTTRPFIPERSTGMSCRSRSFRAGVAPPFQGLISASAPAAPHASIPKAKTPAASAGVHFTRMRSGDLARGHRVLEIVRIERVEAAVGGLALRIHEKPDLPLGRLGQRDVVRIVVGEPVHFPGAEEALARGNHHGIRRGLAAALLE